MGKDTIELLNLEGKISDEIFRIYLNQDVFESYDEFLEFVKGVVEGIIEDRAPIK